MCTKDQTCSAVVDRYYIDVTINGRRIKALIDTGASRTQINESLKQLLVEEGVKPCSSKGMVQMADQSLVTFLHVLPLNIQYKTKRVYLSASVIPTLAETIVLGMDFLSAVNMEIRLNGEILRSSGSKSKSKTLRPLITQDFLPKDKNNTRKAGMQGYSARFGQIKESRSITEHQSRKRHQNPFSQRYKPRKRRAHSFENEGKAPTSQQRNSAERMNRKTRVSKGTGTYNRHCDNNRTMSVEALRDKNIDYSNLKRPNHLDQPAIHHRKTRIHSNKKKKFFR